MKRPVRTLCMLGCAAVLAAALALVFVAVSGGSPGTHGKPGQQGSPAQNGTAGRVYSWTTGGFVRQGYMADDEVAIFLIPGSRLGVAEQTRLARLMSPAAEVLPGSNSFVMFVRVPTGRAVATARAALARQAGALALHVQAVSPVFYLTAAENGPRMVPTGGVIVRFGAQVGAVRRTALAAGTRLEPVRRLTHLDATYLYRAPDALASLAAADALNRQPGVVYAEPDWFYELTPCAVPDDTLFADQWHLANTGQGGGTTGQDIDIEPAWDTYRGSSNEVIAINDDAVEIGHEDLASNVVPDLSWDYVDGDHDPTPALSDENHGTACAGVAAAAGFNTLGVSGSAPSAGLVGYRMLGHSTVGTIANSFDRNQDVVDICSNSWGPESPVLFDCPQADLDALGSGASSGRGYKGTIYVFAGGNGRTRPDTEGWIPYDSNTNGFANSRYVLAVAATDNNGEQSWYSETGANIAVNAPSNGGTLGITTTDRTGADGYASGDYCSTFGGTSAAAPLTAGVAALVLQAKPWLGWRDVQQILMTTAQKNDPTDSDWTTNGAGYHVSYKYGFGRVDAAAATAAAASWIPLGPELETEGSATPNLAIPDNDATGVQSTITVPDDLRAEHVEVYLTAPHTYWGDLQVELTSPCGTKSILARQTLGWDSGYDNWRFGTVRDLGESSKGTWTLKVSDLAAFDTGTFQRWTIKVYGTTMPAAPTGNFILNGGWPYTNSTEVSLDSSTSDATEMQFRNSGGVWSPWEEYTASRTWTLPPGDGTKTVQGQFRNVTGTRSCSDSILLDTVPPVTTDNHPTTPLQLIRVTLTPSDAWPSSGFSDGTRYRIDDGNWHTGTTVVLGRVRVRHKLPGRYGPGAHTITYYSFDRAGNEETPHSCTVTLK